MASAALAKIEEILGDTEDAVFETSDALTAFGFDPIEKENYQQKVNRINRKGGTLKRV